MLGSRYSGKVKGRRNTLTQSNTLLKQSTGPTVPVLNQLNVATGAYTIIELLSTTYNY